MGQVANAELLTVDQFNSEVRPVFDGVFQTLDLRGLNQRELIFQEHIDCGVLLFSDAFEMTKPQFEALAKAARLTGDEFLFEIILYTARPEEQSLRLPISDYEAYDRSEKMIEWRHRGIPMERVLFALSQQWGVFSDDTIAVVGGTDEFVRRFKEIYPAWREELAQFLTDMQAAVTRGVDPAWVQTLLDSLYGNEAPVFAPGEVTS